jgi:hypothetical protein
MLNLSRIASSFRRVSRGRIVGALLLALAATAVFDQAIGPFVLLALAGGGLVAGMMIAAHAWSHRRTYVADVFADDASAPDGINFSRLRVAGVGGLGLVLVAIVVALRFELTAVVMAFGALGGSVGGLLVIALRRHGRLGPGASGPGAHTFLADRQPVVPGEPGGPEEPASTLPKLVQAGLAGSRPA